MSKDVEILKPCAAFSKETLTCQRWLLDGVETGCCALWTSILTITEQNQVLFLKRVLFLHALAFRRAGKACVPRLAVADWCCEVNRMCLGCYIIREMTFAKDHDGNRMFDDPILEKIIQRTVDGPLGLDQIK